MNTRWLARLLLGPAFVVMVTMTARSEGGREFVQTNLVSDIPGLATITSTPGVFCTALRAPSGSRIKGTTRLPFMLLQTRRRPARSSLTRQLASF
jgi:hypothetical protein